MYTNQLGLHVIHNNGMHSFCRMANRIVQGSDGHYFLASHLTPSCLTYDINHTHMLSYGFDGLPNAPFAAVDAALLAEALTESSLVEKRRVEVCTRKEQCTSEAIRSAFRSKVRSTCTGENGLFIFAYHGPAVVCSNGWSLVPSNFDLATPSTHITAAVILQWLEELDVKPRKVLFFLDCQFAREIANVLTSDPIIAELGAMCAFCANSPLDTPLLTSSLQHSVFSYFTAWVFEKISREPTQSVKRIIAVKDASEIVKDCCSAITSLCVTATSSSPEVVSVQVQPFILRAQDTRNGHDMIDGEAGEGEDETDGSVGRFTFIEKHYSDRSKKQKPRLSDQSYGWLNWLKHSSTSPLRILHRHGALTNSEVQLTVLRLLLYSTAMIQSNIDTARQSIGEPNFLIMLYMEVVAAIEHVTGREVRADAGQFEHSVEAYHHALRLRQVKDSEISKLEKKICK